MEFTFSTLTSRFTTLASKLIDRAFDHRLIGEERLIDFFDLIGEKSQGLAELGEFLFIFLALYAQYIISIQILAKNASKK